MNTILLTQFIYFGKFTLYNKFSNYGNCSLLKHLLISLKPLSPHQPSPPWPPRPVGMQLGMVIGSTRRSSNMLATSRAMRT
jgi:hypothetical protein